MYDTTGIVKLELRATNNNAWQPDKSKIRPEELVYPIDHGISIVSSFEMDIYDWIQSTGFGSEVPVSSHV